MDDGKRFSKKALRAAHDRYERRRGENISYETLHDELIANFGMELKRSSSTLNNWFSDEKNAKPDADAIRALAKLYGISPEAFYRQK